MDGFQARCLRDILRIEPSYYSRVSNHTVRDRAQQKPLSQHLHRQQLLMFGRIARLPNSDIRRQLTFCSGSLRAATDRYVRKVGRPKHEWAPKLLELALSSFGSMARVTELVMDRTRWISAVASKF